MPPARLLLSLLCLFLLPAAAVAQWDDNLLRPFVIDHRAAGASPADVSFLLEAPAGKNGFVRVAGGHLVKPDGTRLRLWGVHLTDWSRGSVLLPPKEDIPMWARTLARFGVNCVRLHFLDLDAPRGLVAAGGADSRSFDPQQLDRLDFLVSELKKRGIYVDLNLNVGRSYKSGDGVRDFDKIGWAKGLTLYDPRLIELEKDYARNILTHVNPYTKTEYRNEPAVAIVEILNENGLWVGFKAPTAYYDDELTHQYNTWLSRKLAPAQVQRLRDLAGVAADTAVPRLKGPEVGAAPKERFDAEMSFIGDAESKFYLDMASYLKDSLGVKVPITGTADHSHSGSSYSMLASLAKLDVLDGHVYWQHPGSPPPVNTPMVNDPLHSTVVQLSRTAMAGKPYTVSEFNHPFPNEWASEGIPILAAYASFQDWDAVIVYTFEPKKDPDWKPYVGDPFDISLDPVRMTQMAAGAVMFLRGDVRAATQTVIRSYSREQAFESRRLDRAEQPYFTPGYPLALPLLHGTRIGSLDGSPTGTFAAAGSPPMVSDTKELTWFDSPQQTGLVTVNTDRTQALIGFVKANGKSVKNLSANIDNTFASIVLASLDSKPLSRAGRMLLTAGSRVTNTGFKWNPERTRTLDQGGTPSLIEPVTGAITLRDLEGAIAVSATALDGAGNAIGEPIRAKKSAAEWTLPLGNPVTTWYVVVVERRTPARQQPIVLWPNGAPGSAAKTADEVVRLTEQGEHIVSSVHHPSITPFLPDSAIATGAAVIVIPGGGHRELWMDHEGYRVGQWLSDHGMAAFVLKYRLAREPGSTYTVEGDALADVQRAIRLVRSRASAFHVSADRVGVIGFSAGGELAALAGTRDDGPARNANDPVDRERSTPAFMGLIYPAIPRDMTLSKDTPAAFLLAGANDSPPVSEGLATLYLSMKRAGASAEMHVLAGVGHGFGVRESNPREVADWLTVFRNWLGARGILVERAAVGQISPQLRDGIAGARWVPEYTSAERASAVQRALKLAALPSLGAPVTLTPNAPYGPNGAQLSFWKPSFVLGAPSGGEAGVNFWGIHNEGHVNVGFTPGVAKSHVLDCRLLSTGRITYKVFGTEKETSGRATEIELVDNHFVLVLPASKPGVPISVELWPTPVTQTMGFLGCDLATIELARRD